MLWLRAHDGGAQGPVEDRRLPEKQGQPAADERDEADAVKEGQRCAAEVERRRCERDADGRLEGLGALGGEHDRGGI